MNSGTDNPKQQNNQKCFLHLLWNALYGFWGFRLPFPVMVCSGQSQNEFAFPKPTAHSWGGWGVEQPHAGWQGEGSLESEGEHSMETGDVENAYMNN